MKTYLEKALSAVLNKEKEAATTFFESYVQEKKKELRESTFDLDVDSIISEAEQELNTDALVDDEYKDLDWFETKDWFYSVLPSGQIALSPTGDGYVVTVDPVVFPLESFKDDFLENIWETYDDVIMVKEQIDLSATTLDITGYDDLEWVDETKKQVDYTPEEKGLTEKAKEIFEWVEIDGSDVKYTYIRPGHFYLMSDDYDGIVEVFVEDDDVIFNATPEELLAFYDEAVDKGQLPELTEPEAKEDTPDNSDHTDELAKTINSLKDNIDQLSKEFAEINGMETDNKKE